MSRMTMTPIPAFSANKLNHCIFSYDVFFENWNLSLNLDGHFAFVQVDFIIVLLCLLRFAIRPECAYYFVIIEDLVHQELHHVRLYLLNMHKGLC
jgi:hypothetical protein